MYFRSSACPSWVRLCRNPFSAFGLSELFFSVYGFHARVVNTTLSINQVRSPYPTQSPCICFYGFLLDFGSLKGRYIFGQSTLF